MKAQGAEIFIHYSSLSKWRNEDYACVLRAKTFILL